MKNHGKFIYGLIGLCLLAFVGMAWATGEQEHFKQGAVTLGDVANSNYFGGSSTKVVDSTNVVLNASQDASFNNVGIYGGGKGFGVKDSSLTVDLSGASPSSDINCLAAGSWITAGSTVTDGNVTLNVKDLGGVKVYDRGITGAVAMGESAKYINTGNIKINMDDASEAKAQEPDAKLMVSAFYNNCTQTIAELNNIELQIKRGSFRQLTTIYQNFSSVSGGNAEALKVNGDINVTISGGTNKLGSESYPKVAPYIYAGPFVTHSGWTVNGNIKLTISGGEYKNRIGFGYGNAIPDGQKMHQNGNIDMIVSGDEGAAAISGLGMVVLGGVIEKSADIGKYEFGGKHAAITLQNLDAAKLGTRCTYCGAGVWDQYATPTKTTPVNKIDGAKLVFDNVSGTFGGTIVSMDVLEVRPGTAVTFSKPITDVKTISITGDWKNLGASRTVMKLSGAAPESVALSAADAIGVASVKFNAARTEVIVTPKNSPVSVSPASLKLNVGESEVLTAKTAVSGETVAWKSGKPEVATVDTNGRVTAVGAGIAVISALGNLSSTTASCTVTVVNTANPDPVPTPASVTTETVTSADNPVAQEKVPDIVKVVTPEAIAATDENKTDIAAKAGVDSADLSETSDGQLVIAPAIAKQAVEAVMAGDAAVQPKQIVSLPIVTADVDKNKVAALAFKVNGAELGATANSVVSDIALIKVLRRGGGAKFTYVSDPAAYATKCFTLKGSDGKSLARTDKVDPTAVYTLVVFIQDNDADGFDYDARTGYVIDPLAIATNAATAPSSAPASGDSGSGGGCSAGFPLLALLVLAPLAYRRKR